MSLFNKILNVDNCKENSDTENTNCKLLKQELTTNFNKYNTSKSNKEEALLNKIQIEKQLIEAQSKINEAINNINIAASSYNETLTKLHTNNCGT